MNPIIVTTIIALAGFILSIFSASWLNQRSTERLVEQLDQKFVARFDAVNAQIQAMEQTVDARLKFLERTMDARFKSLEQTMNARFDTVNTRFDSVEFRLTSVESRLDHLEQAIFKPVLPGS
ncbi:MAG TPA: hypothetical protein VNQ79_17350 [Blastocatellia bacterium]|nr:hypothetical protein [Blastocatellia bacterium]